MAKLHCRRGDTAIIVSSSIDPTEVGRLVKVVRKATALDVVDPNACHQWLIRSLGGPLLSVIVPTDGQGRAVRGRRTKRHEMESVRSDFRLRPIRPGAEDDSKEVSKARPRRQRGLAPTCHTSG